MPCRCSHPSCGLVQRLGSHSTLAPGATLLVIARARDPDEEPGSLPWPLTEPELRSLLPSISFSLEDYTDTEDPPSAGSAPPSVADGGH
jgi:hypothetical protein